MAEGGYLFESVDSPQQHNSARTSHYPPDQKDTTRVVQQPIRRLREEKMGFKKLAEYITLLMLVIETVKVKLGDLWVQPWELKMTKAVVPDTMKTQEYKQ